MRFSALIVLLLLCGCAFLPRTGTETAPLEISGVLNGNTVLRGYVVVTGDVLVPPGGRLEIRRGSTVVVRNSESTKIDPEYLSAQTEILVKGTLVVAGEPDANVKFIPERMLAPGETAWAGIILDGADASVISNATLVQAETGILVIDASPQILDNRIIKSRYGVIVQGGAAKILGNEISGGEAGVFCWNNSQPYLKGNVIVGNDEEGVAVDRSSKPYLDRNTISGNDIGLVVPEQVPFDPTLISGNREDVRFLGPGKETAQ